MEQANATRVHGLEVVSLTSADARHPLVSAITHCI